MACYTNNPYAKSCVRTYNNATQAITAAATTLALGNVVVDSGVSIDIGTNSFTVKGSGLYHLAVDVTYLAPPASSEVTSTVEIQLCKDGVVLPCADSKGSVESSGYTTVHVETDLVIPTCRLSQPVISVQTLGAAGTITHVCAGVTKLA